MRSAAAGKAKMSESSVLALLARGELATTR